jgi:SAM-dependent methyltransferase
LKQPKYYDLAGGIYIRRDDPEDFGYSDGNETEEYLLSVITEASDVAMGSEELAHKIMDWPSLYHLSPQRADLLRPFSDYLKGRSVLEIGSGCGAITRFLGETAAEVVSVEGSRRRARITAARCRDLANVMPVNDNFDRFRWEEQFDVVTLIGVLEYSNLFIKGSEPAARLLEKARAFLKKDGVLIIAIENKLGSKYWAGAPEDHTGQAYYGIENRYNSDTAITFGKEELSVLLKDAGYTSMEFLFPFPDYKLPTVILREKYLDTPAFNVANLLMSNADYFQGRTYESAFSLPLALKQIVANKLVGDLSNSFLVVAGGQPAVVIAENTIGHTFSSLRKRPYAKENRFVLKEDGQISVQRIPLYPGIPSLPHPWLTHHMEEESYLGGSIYFNRFIEIVSQPGWTEAELVEWATPFYRLLKELADEQGCLTGRYVDAVPFNMLLQGEDIRLFDLEWSIAEPLPLHYILCRGIYFAFGRVNVFRRPVNGMPERMFAWVEKILDAFVPEPGWVVQDFLEREKKYFGSVGLKDDYRPADLELRFNESFNEKEKEVDIRIAQIAEKDGLIEELKAENNRFKDSIAWYRSTYETRSWAGLLLTHFFKRGG